MQETPDIGLILYFYTFIFFLLTLKVTPFISVVRYIQTVIFHKLRNIIVIYDIGW